MSRSPDGMTASHDIKDTMRYRPSSNGVIGDKEANLPIPVQSTTYTTVLE